MAKFFIATFNRASDGALSKVISKMKEENLYTDIYQEADYIIAIGDRIETYDFVLERFRENYRIIHLWAGEIDQGTHDEVYRHSITLMSELQLCTNQTSKSRVIKLCKSVDKEPNAYVIGNVMLDNMTVDESLVPNKKYNLILYNPITRSNEEEVLKEIDEIQGYLDNNLSIWIEPNGDKFSDLVNLYVTSKTIPREKFLGLIKNCNKFITNSSCQYYEAPFLLDKTKIIPIGKRNTERESKYSNMKIEGATNRMINILKEKL